MLVMVSACAGTPALAGWFTRGPDPKTEAANHALERAARIAAEAAAVQAQQHKSILEAVTALSNERTHLAAQLTHLGQLAARDTAWAAAVHTIGPVLVAVAVLAVGGVALWMVTRTSEQDAQLASVLVDEIAGTGTGLLLHGPGQHRLDSDSLPMNASPPTLLASGPAFRVAGQEHAQHPAPETQEGELPF